MKMLNNKVLLRLVEDNKKEHMGLIIVDKKEPFVLCEVVGVSSDEKELYIGDRVLVERTALVDTPKGYLVDRKSLLAIVE